VFAVDRAGAKLTDFNDLHALEGVHVVRDQVETQLRLLRWPTGTNAGASTSSPGSGGEPPGEGGEFHFSLDVLLRRYALIYGTDTAFDERQRMIIGLGPLRSAAGRSLVRMWLEHPDRRLVTPDQVGFDPAGTDPNVVCNLWGGWPTAPKKGRCDALLRILEHLCAREDKPREVFQWMLRWMAYPLQNPGAKMQTALLIHGPEGTGKNTFFGAVRQAYGEYGFTFTQVELESQFNGIFSGKLFGIGNEVVSRAELYHLQGRLRNMVFFSNRIDIAKLDPDDRRYCVVWTPPPADPALYLEAKSELEDGGAAALHWHLANEIQLGGFDAHTKPPMTRAKRELIGLGMDSTERFWREWSGEEGELRSLFTPCTSAQLYSAYQLYCRRLGVGKPAQQETLSTLIGKKPGMKLDRAKVRGSGMVTRQQRCVFPPGLHDPPDHVDKSKLEWLSDCVRDFDDELQHLQDDGSLPLGNSPGPGRGRKGDDGEAAAAARG
jgi:putative DNA primase/helicase